MRFVEPLLVGCSIDDCLYAWNHLHDCFLPPGVYQYFCCSHRLAAAERCCCCCCYREIRTVSSRRPPRPPHKLCLRNVVQDLRRINGGTTFEKYFCATCQGEPIVMMCSAGRSVSGLVATCTGVYLCDCEEADKRLCKVE